MAGLIDIHAHLIPGIDDGPPDMEQSIAMVRAAAEAGITRLVSTPHLRADFPGVDVWELSERLELVRMAVDGEVDEVELVDGAEVSLTWALEASSAERRLASYRQHGTDLLIETPTTNASRMEPLLYELRMAGYRITLAHPERSLEFQERPGSLTELVERGYLLQINAGSLLGDSGSSGVRKLARWLCTEALAHAMASDAHRGREWRPISRLARGCEALRDLVGPDRAEWMTAAVPAAILAGDRLPSAPDVVAQGSRLRLRRR